MLLTFAASFWQTFKWLALKRARDPVPLTRAPDAWSRQPLGRHSLPGAGRAARGRQCRLSAKVTTGNLYNKGNDLYLQFQLKSPHSVFSREAQTEPRLVLGCHVIPFIDNETANY